MWHKTGWYYLFLLVDTVTSGHQDKFRKGHNDTFRRGKPGPGRVQQAVQRPSWSLQPESIPHEPCSAWSWHWPGWWLLQWSSWWSGRSRPELAPTKHKISWAAIAPSPPPSSPRCRVWRSRAGCWYRPAHCPAGSWSAGLAGRGI